MICSRHKNIQALADLDISPVVRLQHIYHLSTDHFIAGPKPDLYDPTRPDYFEFGVRVKGLEVYIKLSLGLPGKPVDCMSFHAAEFPIVYPLKNDEYEE